MRGQARPDRRGEHAAARREIEQSPRLPSPDDPRGATPPQKIHTAAQQGIGKVIARGNPVEHAPDAFRFFHGTLREGVSGALIRDWLFSCTGENIRVVKLTRTLL